MKRGDVPSSFSAAGRPSTGTGLPPGRRHLVCAAALAGSADCMGERQEHELDDEPTEDEADLGASDGSPAADKPPALPADDDAALGDTDQHSDA